jgi:membrane protease YdiL (CAAX protease family)
MKPRYLFVLIIFLFLMGPGPEIRFLNKYTVAFLPFIGMASILYLLKDEIAGIDWNAELRNKETYRWYFKALQISIYAQAACTLLFRPGGIVTDTLIASYPIMPFYAIVAGPVAEEIVFRKILFGWLDRKWNFWAAAAVASTIFAIAHLSLGRALGYFAVGLAFCYAYKKSGSLAPSILAHASLNFISIFVTTLKG